MNKSKCKYCSFKEPFFINEEISTCSWGWGDIKISIYEALMNVTKKYVFIDRGFIRLGDIDDSDCMDHGAKVKINFCPMCGKSLQESGE